MANRIAQAPRSPARRFWSRVALLRRQTGGRDSAALAPLLLAIAAIAFTAIGLTTMWSSAQALEPTGLSCWWHVAFALPACAVLLIRRRRPVVSLAVVTALSVGDLAIGGSLAMILIFWEALYSASYFAGERARSWILRVVAAAVVIAAVVAAVTTGSVAATVFIPLQVFAVLGTPYWWATNVRQKAELAELAEQRAADLDRLAALRETQLVRRERARMARDLHDVIAGQLSAIAIHSEAALSSRADLDRSRAALTTVREMSLTGLAEMRSMIVLLRDGAEPASTVGGLDRFPEITASARAAGLTVEVDETGFATLPELPSVVEHAAARILQESLTNAAKHSPGAIVSVKLQTAERALRLVVSSRQAPRSSERSRPRSASPVESAGTRLGLVTMSERALALGGSFRAGWTDESRSEWTVDAVLPFGEPS